MAAPAVGVPAQFMCSKHGARLLLHESHKFSSYVATVVGERPWRCTKKGCRAKAYTSPEGDMVVRTAGSHNHVPSKNLVRERLNNAMRSFALMSSDHTKPSDIIKEMVATNGLGDELKSMSKRDIKLIRDSICRIKSKRTVPLFLRKRGPQKIENWSFGIQEAQVPLPIKVEPYAEVCSTTNDAFQTGYRSEDANESRSSAEVVIKIEPDYLHQPSLASDTSLKHNANSTETLEHSEMSADEDDPLSITTPGPKARKPVPAEPSAVQYEKTTERDPIDDFFQAMATTVKALPPLLQLQVKQKVTQAVFEAESVMLSMN